MAENQKVTVDLTTGIGTLSFPHLFASTKSTNDKGETVYDCQFIIPKSQRDDVRKILAAIKKVGEAKWGANWKKVRQPLRDGDAEADNIADDGKTYGEKYPERLGAYFINARSYKPVGVYDRLLNPILEADEVYSGCKVKISVSFYPYSKQGNTGIGVSLNGVQKISDGDPIGGAGKPSVESMFEVLEDDEDVLDDDIDVEDEIEEEVEEAPAPRKRAAAKKAPAKKAAARRPVKEVEVEEDEDDLYDLDEDDDL